MAAAAGAAGVSILGDVMQYGTTANANNTAQQSQEAQLNRAIAGWSGFQKDSSKAWDPYQQFGLQGMEGIKNIGKDINSDPSFQFAVNQGTNVMNQQAGARGHFFAPQTMEALTAYGQNIGSEWYQQAFNNQMAQVNVGQNATSQATNQGFNIQSMLSNLYSGIGDVQAQGAMAGAAAQNKLIGGVQGAIQGGISSAAMSGGTK